MDALIVILVIVALLLCAGDRPRARGGLVSLCDDPVEPVEVVPDDTSDAALAEMRASGRLAVRRSEGLPDLDD